MVGGREGGGMVGGGRGEEWLGGGRGEEEGKGGGGGGGRRRRRRETEPSKDSRRDKVCGLKKLVSFLSIQRNTSIFSDHLQESWTADHVIWMADGQTSECLQCHTKFSAFKRKVIKVTICGRITVTNSPPLSFPPPPPPPLPLPHTHHGFSPPVTKHHCR